MHYFKNLDGLRVIAFFFVLFNHTMWRNTLREYYQGDNEIIKQFIDFLGNGGLGVSIFFTLSGFLITYIILTEIEATGGLNIKRFYIKRILRIWPLYFVLLLFSFLIYPALRAAFGVESLWTSNVSPYVLFLSNFEMINLFKYYPEREVLFLSITWSIAIEEQFYLVWPFFFKYTSKKLWGFVPLLLIILSVVFQVVYRKDDLTLYYHTVSCISDLSMGGLLAYLTLYHRSVSTTVKQLSKKTIVGIYIMAFLILIFSKSIIQHEHYKIVYTLIAILFFAFVIAEQNLSKNSFYKFSSSRLMTSIGKYTYGLYLLHPIVILFVGNVFEFFQLKSLSYSILECILIWLVSIMVSFISYHYFEKHFLKLKSKFDLTLPQPVSVLPPSFSSVKS